MKDTIRFGIVQGRLTQSPPDCLQWFPQDCWQNEFKIAKRLGFNYIELIADVQYNENNPIWTDDGIKEIKSLVKENQLTTHTLCNDYIVENSFLDDEVIQQNINLIMQGKKIGIDKYIMPFFDSSEITKDNIQYYISPIRQIASIAKNANILICLETILTGEELIELIRSIDMPNVKVVYDTGNRVAFGHDLSRDIRLLGDQISHVHIKDKNKDNQNVLLGTGLVNFDSVFHAFESINYSGPYTFETTRGSDPINTARYNMNFVSFFKANSKNA